MPRINLAKLLSILLLTLWANHLSAATVTYAVGTCEPKLTYFLTISAALAATPVPNVVEVCPGTYHEQVTITESVILEGVTSGGSAQAIIAPPPNGLLVNATDDLGDAIAAQVYISAGANSPGPQQLTDITIDGSGNGITASTPYVVGIFSQNASVTINRVTTRNQMGNGGGVGIWIEGGLLLPAVTVENSSIHGFDLYGIWVQTNAAASELTATIKDNDVNGGFSSNNPGPSQTGILINSGTTTTATSNVLASLGTGIWTAGTSTGVITNCTFVGDSIGILLDSEGVTATGNKIYDSCPGGVAGSCAGIQVDSAMPAVQNNTIINSPVGIEFSCVANPNVHSNTITDGTTGLDQVPAGLASSDSIFDVFMERAACVAGAARLKAAPAPANR